MRPRTLLALVALPAAPIALAAVLVAGAAAADPVPSLDLRGFTAPTDPASGLSIQPADSRSGGEWSVGLFTSYAYRPITLRDAHTGALALDVIKHQVTSDLVGSIGLWHRLELGFDLPVLVYQAGDAPTTVATAALGTYRVPGQAFGDLGLDAKLTIVRPTHGDAGGFALALHERLSVPTGDPASFLGEGTVTDEVRFLAEYRLAAVGIHAALGLKLRGHFEDFGCAEVGLAACSTRFGHEIPFGLGVSVVPRALGLDAKGRMTWFLEMNGHLPAAPIAPFHSTAASSVQLDAAARFALGADVSLLAGVQTALLRGVGDAPFRGVLAISWSPRSHDRDGDGIPDDVDRCPDLAEDFDGYQDADGCPELDNDEDGIPDKLDKCPDTKEDIDGYQDADGCPDPDNDQDRIPDTEDACPNEPGPPDPDPKKNGCPIREPKAEPAPPVPPTLPHE
jgi:OOP family OmpA-OmpF porin